MYNKTIFIPQPLLTVHTLKFLHRLPTSLFLYILCQSVQVLELLCGVVAPCYQHHYKVPQLHIGQLHYLLIYVFCVFTTLVQLERDMFYFSANKLTANFCEGILWTGISGRQLGTLESNKSIILNYVFIPIKPGLQVSKPTY